MKKIILPLLCAFLYGFPVVAAAPAEELPVKVNADDMVYDMQKNTVHITGNVVVTRGDFVLNAKAITLFLTNSEGKVASPPRANTPLTGVSAAGHSSPIPSDSLGNSNIERIEAEGDVRFQSGSQTGESKSATYEAAKGLLTLRGDPVVRDGENSVRGDVIRYYTNERRSEVVGTGKKRVEAVFGTAK